MRFKPQHKLKMSNQERRRVEKRITLRQLVQCVDEATDDLRDKANGIKPYACPGLLSNAEYDALDLNKQIEYTIELQRIWRELSDEMIR